MKWLIAVAMLLAIVSYAVIMSDVLVLARSQAYFESHPDQLRSAIEQCRDSWFWWPECENAEAAATY